MDKIDYFLEKVGIELLPYQKEILRHTINGEKLYFLPPSYSEKYYFQNLLYMIHILFSKGEE